MISISLNKASVMRGKNKHKPLTKKRRSPSGGFNKVDGDTFKKMSRKDQDAYLDQYPKSSHRLLQVLDVKEDNQREIDLVRKKHEKANKDRQEVKKLKAKERLAKARKMFPSKIERERYDLLDIRTKGLYNVLYTGTDKFKKHAAEKKPNIIQQNKTNEEGVVVKSTEPSQAELKESKAQQTRHENSGRDYAKSKVAGGMTNEAFDAVGRTSPEDLKSAADNLDDNKSTLLEEVEDSLHEDANSPDKDSDTDESKDKEKKPKKGFVARDLETLRSIFSGNEISTHDGSKVKAFITVMSRYMLLGCGVLALATGAAPIAIQIGKNLFDSWKDFNPVQSSNDEDDYSDEDGDGIIDAQEDVLSSLYDAIADQLRYMDHKELLEFSEKMRVSLQKAKDNALEDEDSEDLTDDSYDEMDEDGDLDDEGIEDDDEEFDSDDSEDSSEEVEDESYKFADDDDDDRTDDYDPEDDEAPEEEEEDEDNSDDDNVSESSGSYSIQSHLTKILKSSGYIVESSGSFITGRARKIENLNKVISTFAESVGYSKSLLDNKIVFNSESSSIELEFKNTNKFSIAFGSAKPEISDRISYRVKPDERKLLNAERTFFHVCVGGDPVGSISVDLADGSKPSPSLRIWKARLYSGFDPIEFPHLDEDELGSNNEPYITTNDDPEIPYNLELINPLLMTVSEARSWVRSILNGE